MEEVALDGVRLWRTTESECVDHIIKAALRGQGGRLVTPNLDILQQCNHDSTARELITTADLRVADGKPLIWASLIQGTPLPERVSGSNLVPAICSRAAAHNLRIFLLGGADDTAIGAARKLSEDHPGIDIVGAYGPPFGFEREPEQIVNIIEMITAAQPDIVFMGLPFPKAEQVQSRIRGAAPNAWWCGIGVTFSFITGNVRRAPKWMQRMGLEWLHRMCQEPGRLIERYLVRDLPYLFVLLGSAFRYRFSEDDR